MNQKSMIVILGVVVIILIGTAVYFATTKDGGQQSIQTPTAQQKAQPIVNQPTQQNNTSIATVPADWQTYTNEKYGFEFKHPQDIGYLSPEGGLFLGFLSDKNAKETNILVLGKKEDEKTVLFVNSGFENKNIIMQEFRDNADRFDIYSSDINETTFKKYSLKNGVYNGYNKAYLYEDARRFIVIRFIDSTLANQIFSTFKFIK